MLPLLGRQLGQQLRVMPRLRRRHCDDTLLQAAAGD
jgi:hypothetical protein